MEDVSEFLVRAGLTAPLGEVPRTVTYQDACHLVHGQKVRSQPRELLLSIPGLDLVEMQDPDRCCGSAGIYNIVQPEMSQQVLDAKMENVLATGTDCVVAGNPGCLLQLNVGLKQHGRPAARGAPGRPAGRVHPARTSGRNRKALPSPLRAAAAPYSQ